MPTEGTPGKQPESDNPFAPVRIRRKYLEIAAPVTFVAIGLMLVMVVLAPNGWQYVVPLDLAILLIVAAYALRRAEILEGVPHRIPDGVPERCDICDEQIPQKDMQEHISSKHPSYAYAIKQSFLMAAAVMVTVATVLFLATSEFVTKLQVDDILLVLFLCFASAFLVGAFAGSGWMKRRGKAIRVDWETTRRDSR